MAVMDEFREERAALKNADFKTKWQYFLDYYKWYVIGGAAALFFVISLAYSMLTAKDSALSGFFLNTYCEAEQNDAFTAAFGEAAGIDLNEYEIMIDSTLQYTPNSMDENSYTSSQKLMVTIAASEVDFVAANEEAFDYYASIDTFFDLREIFTEEDLAKLAEYIYYVDMDVVREREAVVDSGKFENYVAPIYDHFKPEEMGDPTPIAFCIQDCPKLANVYYFREGAVPMGLVVNTQRLDMAKEFVYYLFEEKLQ